METVNTATLHATRPERVLSEFSCTSNVQGIDNLSSEIEEELLYGCCEDVGDCDEEETLSDDSLRLRFSEDDENDPDDTRAPGLICNQHTNSKNDTIDRTPDVPKTSTSNGRTRETKSTNHDKILIENDIAMGEELRPVSGKGTSETEYSKEEEEQYSEMTNAYAKKSPLNKMELSANGFTKDYLSYEQVDPTNAVRNEEIQIGDCTSQNNTEIATEVKKGIDDDGNEAVCTSEETSPGYEPSAEVVEEEEEKKKDDDSTSASVRDESLEEDRKEEELRDSSVVGNEEEPVKSDQLEEIGELCVVASNGALQPFNNVDASSRLDEKEEKSSPDPSPLRNEEQMQVGSEEQIVAVENTSKELQLENESARQKRKTARGAEGIIRNKSSNSDSNLDLSDGSEMAVTLNDQANVEERTTSITTGTTTATTTAITSTTTIATDATTIASPPHTLKRKFIDNNLVDDDGNAKTKTMKASFECEKDFGNVESSRNCKEAYKELAFVQKFFQRDAKQKLVKLKQEELEELLTQKIVDAIAMRGEIGRLREQARISEKNQEATRIKCQQLANQIRDFEMVLSRNAADRRANDKPVRPIKINRSVGLQVNFLTDHGVQSLQQLQQRNTAQKSSAVINGTKSNFYESSGNTTNPRREIIVRAPRIPEASTPIATEVPTTVIQVPSHSQISTATPVALVVTKPLILTLPAQCSNPQPILPKPTQQSVVLNGKLPILANRQPVQTLNTRKNSTNDVIDLTDDGTETMKSSVGSSVPLVPQGTVTSKAQTPRFQRVIQTFPGNMSLATQPTSIRVVQPSSQLTPTALVTNMNAPRLAYEIQGAPGMRQLLITSSPNQIRPISSPGKTQYSAVTYKTGMPTIVNGTVRLLTTPANSSLQLIKHPAPLPEIPIYARNSAWKLPPPAPSLKISKVAYGIVLSWNMALSNKHADIASFQLYAYQEVAGVPPSTSLWKKVGDVRAMPLPMACKLSQFSEGNTYHFAIRGVDTHSRLGQYSPPRNISLQSVHL